MRDKKQTNTQEMLGSLRDISRHAEVVRDVIPNGEDLVRAADRIDRQLLRMNSQLRSIRHCCNFVVLAIMFCFLAFVWQLFEFYASMQIEQY